MNLCPSELSKDTWLTEQIGKVYSSKVMALARETNIREEVARSRGGGGLRLSLRQKRTKGTDSGCRGPNRRLCWQNVSQAISQCGNRV